MRYIYLDKIKQFRPEEDKEIENLIEYANNLLKQLKDIGG